VIGLGLGELVVIAVALLCALPFFLLPVFLILTVIDTVRGSGRWGINPGPAKCPACGTTAPTFRKPKNFQQAMWGGWTCASCGLELDKWAKPVRADR